MLKYFESLAWPLVTLCAVWVLRTQIRGAFERLIRLETPAGTFEFAAEARDVRDEADSLAVPNTPDDLMSEPPLFTPPGPGPTPYGYEYPQPPPPRQQQSPQPPPQQPQSGPLPSQSPTEHPSPAPWMRSPPLSSDEPMQGPTVGEPQSVLEVPRVRRWGIFHEAMGTVEASPVGSVITAWTILQAFCVNALEDHGQAPQSRLGVYDSQDLSRRLRALGLQPETLNVFDRLRLLRNKAAHRPESVTAEAARDFVRSCQTVATEVQRFG